MTQIAFNVLPENLPPQLVARHRWIAWRYEPREDGTSGKVPYSPITFVKASSTDPSTWTTFDHACAFARKMRLDGVGYVFAPGDDTTGIDLDHCLIDGVPEPWALQIVERFATYTEISPSGEGLHLFVGGELPAGSRHVWVPEGATHPKAKIEVYSEGRYFTVTGKAWPGAPLAVAEQPDVLADFHSGGVSGAAAPAPRVNGAVNGSVNSSGNGISDDDELIRRAIEARSGARFYRLWRGDTSEYEGDDSKADSALCTMLAWWTRGDAGRVDRLFRQSQLMRAKWTEARGQSTYGQQTITRAVARVTKGYDPDQAAAAGIEESPATNGAVSPPPTAPPPPAEPRTLEDVLATFRKWMHLADEGIVPAVLGAVAANRMAGDPVWLMFVGGSGRGKTETLASLSRLPDIHSVATINEAALLSGTPRKERAANASGGLLNRIGTFGFLVLKDFTSILSMQHDARAATLAALRELYDGSWERHIGSDGGRTLTWQGKLAVLAAVTTAIDTHHAVVGSLGERFVYWRLPATDDDELAQTALAHQGKEKQMRAELAAAVAGLFAGVPIPEHPPALQTGEDKRLIDLGVLVARCRSAVERDRFSRDVELILDPEAPTRLVLVLSRLLSGMRVLGTAEAEAWRIATKIGLDCIPGLRRRVMEFLALQGPVTAPSTTEVATAIEYPTQTTRRALEDLAAHQVILREAGGPGKADCWLFTDETRRRWASVQVGLTGRA